MTTSPQVVRQRVASERAAARERTVEAAQQSLANGDPASLAVLLARIAKRVERVETVSGELVNLLCRAAAKGATWKAIGAAAGWSGPGAQKAVENAAKGGHPLAIAALAARRQTEPE